MKFSYKKTIRFTAKTKLGRKIGEKINGKELYIGLPRYEKSAGVANMFDMVVYAFVIGQTHKLFEAGQTIVASVCSAVLFIYLYERFVGGHVALEKKKAGAAE